MKLSSRGVVPYSKKEKEAFALLSRKGQTTSRLVERMELGEEMFAGNSLVGTLNTLARKVVINKESFVVKKSKRQGPHPIFHWIEPIARSKSCLKSKSKRQRS